MKRNQYRKQFVGEDGKRHDLSAPTKKELEYKVQKLKREIEEGLSPIRSKSITVAQWSKECFEKYKAGLSDQSYITQWTCFNKWVNSQIGNVPLQGVKNIDCQTVLNNAEGLASYTLRRIAQLMHFVFEKAVKNNYMRNNPAESLEIPKGPRSHRRALTKYEEDIFIKTVNINPQYVFFLVMLKAGLRNSEVARLQGRDLIQIEGEYFLHVRGTKTENATRDVPCPECLRVKLPKVSPFEYMFKNQLGDKMNKPNYDRLWKHLKRDMNIIAGCKVYRNKLVAPFPISKDLCSYDLRHTYCTNLARARVDIRFAQKIMGHGSINMTADIYSHCDTQDIVKCAKVINDYNQVEEAIV